MIEEGPDPDAEDLAALRRAGIIPSKSMLAALKEEGWIRMVEK